MANSNITRKALGRTAAIGDLYNATNDSFCGKSIFASATDVLFETFEHSAKSSTNQFYNDDSLFNNLIKFDVEPELAVSALCGLLSYPSLNDSVNRRSQCASILHTVKTKSDRLDIQQPKINRLINADDVIKTEATHVVVGIDWGSCSVIAIQKTDEDDKNADDLKDYLQYVAARVSNNGVKSDAKNVDRTSRFTLHFDSDVLAAVSVPEAEDDIVKFIENVPDLIEKEFNGRGKCQSFVLLPLSAFDGENDNLDFVNRTVQPIESKVIFCLGDLISRICDANTKLHAIQTITDKNEFCVPVQIRKVIKMKRSIVEQTLKNITENLVKVRRGDGDTFEFEVIEQTFQDSTSVLDQFFRETQSTIERIEYINYTNDQGVFYIGNMSSFEEARRKIKPKDEYYVLFYAHNSLDEDTSENIGLFNSLIKANDVACILADLDMNPALAEMENVPGGTRICHYLQNGYKDYDVYKTYKRDRILNLIRPLCEMQSIKSKPRKRALVHLVCPKSMNGGECSSDKQQWMCEKCKSAVEYGFDQKFYCDCGCEYMNTFEFRCTDVNHGDDFVAFDTDVLAAKLKEIEVVREVNILVLGETGVGKSTWINAIANYLTFPTLQEADVDDLLCLVPTKFVLLDENCKEKIVSIGSSKNEGTRAGQACTQNTMSHLITFGDERIRIIDTPGIGDPRGVEQDKINVDNILKFVSSLDEIHGICLLLKPNNARLTTFFKFCVKEILTHLHKSSVHNLLFCFTNTRSTFYKPGDTYPALKELLSEINENLKLKSGGKAREIILSSETMFCLDNEAFRFLCARRNNIDFKPEDFHNFSLSWDKSAAETHRMFTYIKSRKPHKVVETMSINEARNTILTLARPMAKITDNIAMNIRITEQQKKFTMSLDDENLKLEKNRMVPQIQIKTVPINYPKTVCTNPSCIEVRLIPGTGENMNVYKTVCHSPCSLNGVNVDTVGAPELRNCGAMAGNDYCKICSCQWQNHMHITYNFEENKVMVPNQSIEKMIRDNAETRLVKEQMIINLEQTIKQYRSEQEEILEISSQFGSLLQSHAILPYNDAFESHVRHELRLASAEACISTDSAKKKDDLERLLREYLEKKSMLDSAMVHNSHSDITVDDVDKLKNQLMNLTLTGESFQNCFQTAANAQSQSLDYVEKRVNINKRNNNKFRGGSFNRFTRGFKSFFNYYSY